MSSGRFFFTLIIQEISDLLSKETIHNNNIAPTIEVTRLPIIPVAAIPNKLNTQPPRTPPTIPTNKLIKSPKPPPLINLPATKPAIIPIIMYQIKYIRFIL
nr:MAG TPA: hypothetical protein [Caudoviricetes sp.]